MNDGGASTEYTGTSTEYSDASAEAAAEAEAARMAAGEAEYAEIQAEIAELTTSHQNLAAEIEELKPNGVPIGAGVYSPEESAIPGEAFQGTAEGLSQAADIIENDINATEALLKRIEDFNKNYGDLNIGGDEINTNKSSLDEHLTGARSLLTEIRSTIGPFEQMEAENAQLFVGSMDDPGTSDSTNSASTYDQIIKYFDDNNYYYVVDEEHQAVYFKDNEDEAYMKICGSVPMEIEGAVDVVFAWPGEGGENWTYDGNPNQMANGMKETIDSIVENNDNAITVLTKECGDKDTALSFVVAIADTAGLEYNHVVSEGHSNGFASATAAAAAITEEYPDAKVTVVMLDSNPGNLQNNNQKSYNNYIENLKKLNGNNNVDFICTTVQGTPLERKFPELASIHNPVLYVNYNPNYSAYDGSHHAVNLSMNQKVTHELDLNHIGDYATLALGNSKTNELFDGHYISEVLLAVDFPTSGRRIGILENLATAKEGVDTYHEFAKYFPGLGKPNSNIPSANSDAVSGATTIPNYDLVALKSEQKGQVYYLFCQQGYVAESGEFVEGGWDKLFKEQNNENLWGKEIYPSGCSIASSASVISTLTGQIVTPDELAKYYNNSDANIGGNFADELFPEYGLNYAVNPVGFGTKDETGSLYIDNVLENGGAVIRTENSGGHYVAILAVDTSGPEKMYFINDPLNRTNPGQWVSESSSRFQNLNQHGNTTIFVTNGDMSIENAMKNPSIKDI